MKSSMFPELFDDVTDPEMLDRLDRLGDVTMQNAGEIYKFKRKLVELRRANGFTQKGLAECMGLKRKQIAKFERYDSDPKMTMVLRYASFIMANLSLDAKPSPLLKDSDPL